VALAVTLLFGGFALGRRAQAQGVGAQPGTADDPVVTKSYVDQFVGLQVVSVPAGQQLIADAGAEIILRAGKATAIATSGGVADLTAGKDLKLGEAIVANHLLLIPRSDGRGLKAVNDLVLMVRGTFVIK
jgi:hypothetical protein